MLAYDMKPRKLKSLENFEWHQFPTRISFLGLELTQPAIIVVMTVAKHALFLFLQQLLIMNII